MKKLKFPSIYRRITDKFLLISNRARHLIIILFLSILLVLTINFGFDLLNNVQNKIQLDTQRQKILAQINYWKEITNKYKGYRDGYFQLAVLEYRLNNVEDVNMYLQKALALDPNFREGRELEQILRNRR